MKRMIALALTLVATSVSASTFEVCQGVTDDVTQTFRVKKEHGTYAQMYEYALEKFQDPEYAKLIADTANSYPADYRYYTVRDYFMETCMKANKEK